MSPFLKLKSLQEQITMFTWQGEKMQKKKKKQIANTQRTDVNAYPGTLET